MRSIVFSLLLAAGFSVLSTPEATAQQTKAYAPQNLNSLTQNDQARVIRQEYSDQSNGRRIPDDQLEFYLAQIRSGWGFSHIQEDIATSLRGNSNQHRPPNHSTRPPMPPSGNEVLCESHRSRRSTCNLPSGGHVYLVEQLSSASCVEGRSWGVSGRTLWVDNGCRGRFAAQSYARPPMGGGNQHGRTIRCESERDRYQECPTSFRGPVVLVEQLSRSGCVPGQDWGSRNGMIWVNNGCRGIFAEGRGGLGPHPGGSSYSVTCNSDDNQHRICAWDRSQGHPRLIENISRTRCVEGSTWGYDSRSGIWVDRGCRARFGTR